MNKTYIAMQWKIHYDESLTHQNLMRQNEKKQMIVKVRFGSLSPAIHCAIYNFTLFCFFCFFFLFFFNLQNETNKNL